jgi:hypothetical protein
LHALGEHGLITDRLRDRYVATHGGSSFGSWRIAHHAPTRSGRAGGTAVTSNFYTLRDNLVQDVVNTLNRPDVCRAMRTINTLNTPCVRHAMRATRMALNINRRPMPPVCGHRARAPRRHHRRRQHIARATSSSDPPGDDEPDPDQIVEQRLRHISGVLAGLAARRAA